jgi:excisionase family DNA binding protein
MGNGKSDGRNLWLRVSEWLHVSAWLPPGLALVWLATLATLVHNVGIMLAAWGATVSLLALIVLLAQRPHASPHNDSPSTTTGQTVSTAMNTATVPVSRNPDLTSERTPRPPILEGLLASELQVLTAEEVASMLRVDPSLVITSISNGELPGNRIGSQWRIDQEALMRWLRGPYGDRGGKDPNR